MITEQPNPFSAIPDDYTDWAITGFRDVRLLPMSDQTARFAAVPVEGDSLKAQHIVDGDFLIMQITSDYQEGKLGIWQTPDGRTAKYASTDPDGFITLHNNDGWTRLFAPGEISLLGLVVRVERDLVEVIL